MRVRGVICQQAGTWRGLRVILPNCCMRRDLNPPPLLLRDMLRIQTLDRISLPLVGSSRDPSSLLPSLSVLAIKQRSSGEAPAARSCHTSSVFRRVHWFYRLLSSISGGFSFSLTLPTVSTISLTNFRRYSLAFFSLVEQQQLGTVTGFFSPPAVSIHS